MLESVGVGATRRFLPSNASHTVSSHPTPKTPPAATALLPSPIPVPTNASHTVSSHATSKTRSVVSPTSRPATTALLPPPSVPPAAPPAPSRLTPPLILLLLAWPLSHETHVSADETLSQGAV
ncbi:hypothetical protein CLOM_g1668 [Closterium sp. NIES-68]|nr:hypothetical protein CLOM_g1668 [Closterium sp. NIES-68]